MNKDELHNINNRILFLKALTNASEYCETIKDKSTNQERVKLFDNLQDAIIKVLKFETED